MKADEAVQKGHVRQIRVDTLTQKGHVRLIRVDTVTLLVHVRLIRVDTSKRPAAIITKGPHPQPWTACVQSILGGKCESAY
jgi:hypothetical protein